MMGADNTMKNTTGTLQNKILEAVRNLAETKNRITKGKDRNAKQMNG